jgi:hypothetical protein
MIGGAFKFGMADAGGGQEGRSAGRLSQALATSPPLGRVLHTSQPEKETS